MSSATPTPCPYCRKTFLWPAGFAGTLTCPYCAQAVTMAGVVMSPPVPPPMPPRIPPPAPPPPPPPRYAAPPIVADDNPFAAPAPAPAPDDNPFASTAPTPRQILLRAQQPRGISPWVLILIAVVLSPAIWWVIRELLISRYTEQFISKMAETQVVKDEDGVPVRIYFSRDGGVFTKDYIKELCETPATNTAASLTGSLMSTFGLGLFLFQKMRKKR